MEEKQETYSFPGGAAKMSVWLAQGCPEQSRSQVDATLTAEAANAGLLVPGLINAEQLQCSSEPNRGPCWTFGHRTNDTADIEPRQATEKSDTADGANRAGVQPIKIL